MKKTLAIAAALATFATLSAQDLSKELEVQHNVVVEHYDAARVALTPALQLPPIDVKPLQFSDRTVSIAIPNSFATLDPAAFADTLATAPWNGYAAIGYFPLYNLGASAGYRLLDNDRQRLNAWLQFDGRSYKDNRTVNPATAAPYDLNLHRNTFTAAVNYHLMAGRRSELDAGIDYTFARFNSPAVLMPTMTAPELFDQTVNRLNAQLQWVSAIEGLQYTVGADYGYFGYGHGYENSLLGVALTDPDGNAIDYAEAWRPVRQNQLLLNGAASLSLSDVSAAYLGLDLSVVSDNRRSCLASVADGNFTYTLVPQGTGAWTHALLSVKPRYRLKNNNMTLTLGALLQFSFHQGKVLHVAPDVSVSWSPEGRFTLWGKATGGVRQNLLGALYDINYMTAPFMGYANSMVPLRLEGGIVAGSFHGAYAELFCGYAKANDWLMPIAIPSTGYRTTLFRGVDLKGWHAGVAFGFKYRRWADVRLSAEAAPSSYANGWLDWYDRARYVATATVKSSPIDGLDLGLTYQWRTRRSIWDRCLYSAPGDIHFVESRTSLGNISDLRFDASYAITPQLSAFCYLDNILCRRVLTLGLVPDQGLHGLVGVAYKF